MPLSNDQVKAVEVVFTAFVRDRFRSLRGIKLDDLQVNPFLARLVARTPAELGRFLVDQAWTRGAVTSMGFKLQSVAREVSTAYRTSSVNGADLEADDPILMRRSLMQVKSGPNTIDKGLRDDIRSKLNEAETRTKQGGLPKGYVLVKMLGMCYGRLDQRNQWVLDLGSWGFDVDHIGRAFWQEVTGDQAAYEQIFNIADRIAQNYPNGKGKTLPEEAQELVNSLTKEIENRYGDGNDGIKWLRLLDDYM